MGMQKRRSKAPKTKNPLNVELDPDVDLELRLRCVHRRAKKTEPWLLREVVQQAIRDWLKKNP